MHSLENLRYPLAFGPPASPGPNIDYTTWLAEIYKPASFLEQNVRSLSGGEQQIVSLLRVIQLAPEAMLLDEPTASLDADSTNVVEQLIDAWLAADATRAYACTSHQSDQIARRSQRIVRMQSGKIVS